MAELNDTLTQLLASQTGEISRRIGADEAQTRAAIGSAVPALLAALGTEAERGTGLRQAIEQDHDGSILDQLSEYLGGTAQLSPRTTNGTGILDHVLGDRQTDMAHALSAKSGLDLSTIMQLLPLLAPIVMGMLGKRSRASSSGGGGFSFDQLDDVLKQEKHDTRSKNPDIGDILDSFARRDSPGASTSRAPSSSRSGGGLSDLLDRLLGRNR